MQNIRRVLAGLLMICMLLGAAAAPAEDFGPEEEEMISPATRYTCLSMPTGDGGGEPVTLRIVPGKDMTDDAVYHWYEMLPEGGRGEKVKQSAEPFYTTEAFDKPEVRLYLCEIDADGGHWYSDIFAAGYTGLPVIEIETEGGAEIESKEDYIPAEITVTEPDGSSEWYPAMIRGRGQATWTDFPKKPYRIKLDEKAPLLGMNAHKKWNLMANYSDKTLLRTAIGLETARILGMEYVTADRFTDVVLNGDYAGCYQLTETVSDAKKALDIGDTGYMVEYVNRLINAQFYSETKEFAYAFQIPDEKDLTEEMKQTAVGEINRLEKILYSSDKKAFSKKTGYRTMVDTESWVQWLLVQNILENQDTNCYIYRTEEGAPFRIGPVWDFEWSLGIGWYDGERPKESHKLMININYLARMLKEPAFVAEVKEKWDEIFPTLEETLLAKIAEWKAEIEYSRILNFYRWPIMNQVVSVGGIPMGDYDSELNCDISFLKAHIAWLDAEIGRRADKALKKQ